MCVMTVLILCLTLPDVAMPTSLFLSSYLGNIAEDNQMKTLTSYKYSSACVCGSFLNEKVWVPL